MICEEAEAPVIYAEKTGQYSVKIPAKVARLMGLQKGSTLRFKASRKGSERSLVVEVKDNG